MEQVAILAKKWNSLNLILSGSKTIESRWYVNRCSPWDKVHTNDVIYFKNSGENIKAKAIVEKVIQYENLNVDVFNEIVKKYGDKIQMKDRVYSEYYRSKKYVILIFLKDVKLLKDEVRINKKGFGSASAWMCLGEKRLEQIII